LKQDGGSNRDTPGRSTIGCGRHTKGRWQCECDRVAWCLTTKKTSLNPSKGQRGWLYDVWSLMMVLSEIAEWKPLDEDYQDSSRLERKQVQRKKAVMDPLWKGN
jgi:hypothetical protein